MSTLLKGSEVKPPVLKAGPETLRKFPGHPPIFTNYCSKAPGTRTNSLLTSSKKEGMHFHQPIVVSMLSVSLRIVLQRLLDESFRKQVRASNEAAFQ